MTSVDVVLVGGGLANCLLALRLRERQPALSVLLVEQATELAGNHTWSYHGSDIAPELRGWLDPLASGHWRGYRVRFAEYARDLAGEYLSLSSDRLRAAVLDRLGERAWCGRRVASLTAGGVTLEDGTAIQAACVIDGTGWRVPPGVAVAYQRFVGADLTLEAPHGLSSPVLMDATVQQEGGYRFVYLLPWSERRILIEDTVYADDPTLDRDAALAEIRRYAERQGWRIRSVDREERGALPLVLAGRVESLLATWPPDVAVVGVRAGLFHATTGYSLPFAAHLADAIARLPRIDTAAVRTLVIDLVRSAWGRQRFFRLLNRMLFRAARPEDRHRVLARFYRLPEPLIERFYADRLTPADRIRLLAGRPPVPVLAALRCIPERATVPA